MSFDKKKFFIFGFILILLVGVPLTVYFLQRQQEFRSRAVVSTTLELIPSAASTEVGKAVNLDVMMNPGTNQVIATTLIITYDPSKFATTAASLANDAKAFPSILEGPVFGPGTISMTMTVGVDVTKAIQTPTKIATVTLNAIAETTGTPTQVAFAKETNVTSTSDPEVNVLSSTKPALITIGPAINPPPPPGGNPPPPPPPPAAPTPTPKSGSAPPGPPAVNKAPNCSNLTVDRAPLGTTPFSITFTATGDDPDGTIQKVTFNFGDGPVQNVVSNNGIGTNSVSVPISHTYNNPGTYTATVVLTDNNGGVSAASPACSQTITASSAAQPTTPPGLGGGGPLTPASPTPVPNVSAPGPSGMILGIGAIGAMLSIIGATVFFAL